MAPYNPPLDCNYNQVDVSGYDNQVILSLIGPGGRGFYNLTSQLGLQYLWWNQDRKVIELWGSHDKVSKGGPVMATLLQNSVDG